VTRIARIVILGTTLGAAARWVEAPNDPGRFFHLLGCALAAYHAMSRHLRSPAPYDDHEAATAYLSPPLAAVTYHYEPTTSAALWCAVSAVWALTVYVNRELESS
jgi:hypothetical protein